MLHMAWLVDLNIKITNSVVILYNFIKVLNHLELPHDNTVVLVIIFTYIIQNLSCFIIGELTQDVDSVLFRCFIFWDFIQRHSSVIFIDQIHHNHLSRFNINERIVQALVKCFRSNRSRTSYALLSSWFGQIVVSEEDWAAT